MRGKVREKKSSLKLKLSVMLFVQICLLFAVVCVLLMNIASKAVYQSESEILNEVSNSISHEAEVYFTKT